MKRWRHNVYRVAPRNEQRTEARGEHRDRREAKDHPEAQDNTLRHADRVYEDVM